MSYIRVSYLLNGIVTLNNGGTAISSIVNCLWNGSVIGVVYGGTAQTSYTKGDILVASGATTLTKLSIGSDAQVLVADSTQTTGIKWATNSPSYGSQSANTFLVGPTSGIVATPTFRAMVNADIPTTLAPQIANLGIGVVASSTVILKSSLSSGYQLIVATQGASETSSVNLIDIATTWNNGANTPTVFKISITDTASNINSLFEDFKVGVTSKWSVRKDGTLTIGIVPASRVTGLATVATTGIYGDLTGRPSLATVATTGAFTDLVGHPQVIMYIDAIGAGSNVTSVDISGFGFGSTPQGVGNCNSDSNANITYDWDDSSSTSAHGNSSAGGTFRITYVLFN